MSRLRKHFWNPAAAGLVLFCAIVAAGLALARVAIEGGLPAVAMVQVLVVVTIVAGLASAGAALGTGRGAMDIGHAGLPARA
jgi:hypothetical protein